MAISVSVQYNGGLLPDIILLTQYNYHRGSWSKCHEEVLYLEPMIPPKRFDSFSPDWGILRRSTRVLIFFKQQRNRAGLGGLDYLSPLYISRYLVRCCLFPSSVPTRPPQLDYSCVRYEDRCEVESIWKV